MVLADSEKDMHDAKELKDKVSSMPQAPGVYLMSDSAGRVIYIGKAKCLKRRLSSYFGSDLSGKAMALMSGVCDIKYILCQTESLSLLLEARLIRKYKPKYNVAFRDDKSFPFVEISDEEFPAIYVTRKRGNDGGRRFGPYTNVRLLKDALKIIRRNFSYRSCKRLPKKPCIYYRLYLCPAPCIGRIRSEEYAEAIENICLILGGGIATLMRRLSHKMNLRSREQRFEEAARIRDQLKALSMMGQSAGRFSHKGELEDLKNILRLNKLPEAIEAIDISNISGREAAGAVVSFYKGLPDNSNYRRFRIKTVYAIDDYKMLREVIRRRYLRLAKEKLPLPDLVIIDGGRSHLLTADNQMKQLRMDMPLISIAKDRENIYVNDKIRPLPAVMKRGNLVKLDADAPALNLIRRIRDEAHRFALAYHHILRRKKTIGR